MPTRAPTPHPCPICKNAPDIDHGFTDEPFEVPVVTCMTVLIDRDLTIRCPMHAVGIEAWNYLCEIAKKD